MIATQSALGNFTTSVLDALGDQVFDLDDYAGKILRPPAPLYCSQSYEQGFRF